MIYNVIYSAESRQDLRDIYKYIAHELMEPDIAAGQANRIMKAIRSLDEMPMRYRLYEDEPWHSRGMRIMPIDNYLVFYLPDEETYIVNIIRIMYSGRDVDAQLSMQKSDMYSDLEISEQQIMKGNTLDAEKALAELQKKYDL